MRAELFKSEILIDYPYNSRRELIRAIVMCVLFVVLLFSLSAERELTTWKGFVLFTVGPGLTILFFVNYKKLKARDDLQMRHTFEITEDSILHTIELLTDPPQNYLSQSAPFSSESLVIVNDEQVAVCHRNRIKIGVNIPTLNFADTAARDEFVQIARDRGAKVEDKTKVNKQIVE